MFRRLFTSTATPSGIGTGRIPPHNFDPTQIQETLNKLPYFVARTGLGKNLPVYKDYKHGGSKVITIIRRISGNPQALASELETVLPGGADVKVRPEMQQIVIKGFHVDRIREFLTYKGF